MGGVSVEVHVERLVVEGFDGLDGRALARALEHELARRLQGGSLSPDSLEHLASRPAVGEIATRATTGAADLGNAVGKAVGELLAASGARAGAIAAPATAAGASAVRGAGS